MEYEHQRSTWSDSVFLQCFSLWIYLGSNLHSLGMKANSLIWTLVLTTETVHASRNMPSTYLHPVWRMEQNMEISYQVFHNIVLLLLILLNLYILLLLTCFNSLYFIFTFVKDDPYQSVGKIFLSIPCFISYHCLGPPFLLALSLKTTPPSPPR